MMQAVTRQDTAKASPEHSGGEVRTRRDAELKRDRNLMAKGKEQNAERIYHPHIRDELELNPA